MGSEPKLHQTCQSLQNPVSQPPSSSPPVFVVSGFFDLKRPQPRRVNGHQMDRQRGGGGVSKWNGFSKSCRCYPVPLWFDSQTQQLMASQLSIKPQQGLKDPFGCCSSFAFAVSIGLGRAYRTQMAPLQKRRSQYPIDILIKRKMTTKIAKEMKNRLSLSRCR